jgi:hypothetical protein
MKYFFFLLFPQLFFVTGVYSQNGLWSDHADLTWDPVAAGYTIETSGQLAQFALSVNNGNTYENAVFILTADIDLSAHYWIPVGEENTYPFYGVFDGNNHTIYGLKVDNTISDYSGVYSALFGRIGRGAEIRNLTLSDGEIKGGMGDGTFSAALVAEVVPDDSIKKTSIRNCHNQGVKVTAGGGSRDAYTGGLIASVKISPEATGNAGVEIENCSNKASVTGICTSNFIGGLIGCLSAEGSEARITVTECFSDAEVNSSRNFTGGLVGRILVGGNSVITMENSHVTGIVKSVAGYTGGLVGRITVNDNAVATVTNCYVSLKELKGGEINTDSLIGKNDNGILSNNENRQGN